MLDSFGDGIIATSLPSRIECGAPDFIVTKGSSTIGYIEAKDIGKSLDEAEKSEQLQRYLASVSWAIAWSKSFCVAKVPARSSGSRMAIEIESAGHV